MLRIEAEKQTVSGMLYNAISSGKLKVNLSPSDAVRVMVSGEKIKFANRKINSELIALASLLRKENIRFFVVKGQTIGSLYPTPLTREPGDIDFYVYPQDFARARDLLIREWNITPEGDGDQHISFSHNGIEMEMHFRLLKFFNCRRQRLFDKMIAASVPGSVTVGSEQIPVPDECTNIIYTFAHLWYHFIELGIGLRQLCDMTVLLDRRSSASDGKDFSRILTEQLHALGLLRAFAATECLLRDRLGLSYMPIPVSRSDERTARRMIRRVFRYGNFGKFGRSGHRGEKRFYLMLTFDRIVTLLRYYRLDKAEIRARLLRETPAKILKTIKG